MQKKQKQKTQRKNRQTHRNEAKAKRNQAKLYEKNLYPTFNPIVNFL